MIARLLRSEDGASALVVAGSMLLIAGMAALVIDVGAGFNERRQDQSAADVASLAAVQFARPSPGCATLSDCLTAAMTNGANEAIAVANASLDDPSQADWSDPAKCASPPAGYPRLSPVSNCVAFSENLERAWVRIPTIDVETTFGGVLGFAALRTSAQAEAEGELDSGSILPFLLPGNAGDTTYNCLKTAGNPSWGECEDLPSTGNFGSMDLFLYGNYVMGTAVQCSGTTNGRLLSNLARGVDHPMSLHQSGAGPGTVEPDFCPIWYAEPNMAFGQPGVGSNLDPGLTVGGSVNSINGPYPGRLSRGGNLMTVRGPQGGNPITTIDDTPLWDYLLPGVCPGVSDVPGMQVCLNAWTSGVMFEDDIADAIRFGFVPEMWEDDFGTPGTPYHIEDFRPVYLDSTYYGCTANSCDIVHTPGMPDAGSCGVAPITTCGVPGSGNDGLVAVTAFILRADMLPEGARWPYPGDPNQVIFSLIR